MTATDQTTYVEAVALGKITTHPDNPRHLSGDVADLAVSIKDHGVLEPLVVVPVDTVPEDVDGMTRGGRLEYCLIAGHRRLAAAKDAKVKTVPVIVRHDLTTREAQIAAMVIENQHRADLSPVEEGEAYQLLLDITPKPTQAKVAQAVGMPKKRISERLRLTKLGDQAKSAVHGGQITLTDALELLAIEQRHPDLTEKATLAAGTNDFPYELTRARQDAEVLDEYDALRAHAQKLGTPVIEKTPGHQPGEPRRVVDGTHGLDLDNKEVKVTATSPIVGTAHAGCPGAVAYIPTSTLGSFDLGWYCTQYKDHHIPTPQERQDDHATWVQEQQAKEEARLAELTDEERAEEERAAAEQAAAEQAHAERKAALDAAQATRRAHFFDVINQGEPALAKAALVDLCGTALVDLCGYIEMNLVYDPIFKDLLGLPVDADDVDQALRNLTIEQIALLLWFVNTSALDDELTLAHLQSGRDLDGIEPEYIRVLTDRYGYQWSSVEITEFNLDEHGHVRTDDDTEAGDAA